MANVIIDDTNLKNIANAIRTKRSTTTKMLPSEMADEISAIQVTTGNVDPSDATATSSDIISGKIAYSKNGKLTGTMKNNNTVNGTISAISESYTIEQGYHSGSGKVSIDATEQAKLIPSNIREGINILGVDGQMSGSEGMKPQSKTITPSSAQQTILPDEGYNCLSQVVVEKIPYVESENSAGGTTVTIG